MMGRRSSPKIASLKYSVEQCYPVSQVLNVQGSITRNYIPVSKTKKLDGNRNEGEENKRSLLIITTNKIENNRKIQSMVNGQFRGRNLVTQAKLIH